MCFLEKHLGGKKMGQKQQFFTCRTDVALISVSAGAVTLHE